MANFPTSVSTDANLYIAVNGLQTTLASPITASDTTITLTSTSGFPTTGLVTIENNEVVSYTGISGFDLTGCTRGADGTTAVAHSTGVTVGLTVVAAHHNLLKDEIIAIETALEAGFARGDISAGSAKITVTGGTGAIIGSGVSVDFGSVSIDDLSDVTLTAPTNGDLLQYNGSVWVNVASSSFGVTSLTGTANQVLVNGTSGSPQTGALTLTTPQNIGTASTPTFASETLSATANQLTLGTTNTTTITSPAPSASRTVTIPDAGANSSVVLTESSQTINGAKTFTNNPQVSPTGAGDAYIGLNINSGASWSVGADDSASDAFVISNSSTPGTDDAISISTGEVVTIPVQGIVHGTTTNDSAAAGFVGEYVESNNTTPTNAPTSNQYGDLTSISLTAGDWSVNITGIWSNNGATWTAGSLGIGTVAGNTSPGAGNLGQQTFASSSTTPTSFSVAVVRRILIASTTTVYLKYLAVYSAGTPQATGRISARRMR